MNVHKLFKTNQKKQKNDDCAIILVLSDDFIPHGKEVIRNFTGNQYDCHLLKQFCTPKNMTGGLGPRCAFEWVTTVVAKNAVKSQEWRTASMIGLLSSVTVRLIRKYIYFAQ